MAGSAFLHPETLLDAASVRFGHHVADIGAGRTGHLVFPLSRRVGEEGKVYAVDIDPEAVQMVEGLRRIHGAQNVHAVWGDAETRNAVGVPEASLDVAFLVHALWSMKNHLQMVEEVSRLMKDSGRIFVVDWRPSARHPLAPPADFRHHPELIDVFFAEADWRPTYEVRLTPHHWARSYERFSH